MMKPGSSTATGGPFGRIVPLNSEVLPFGSVAVAAITFPPDRPVGRSTLKLAVQLSLVVTSFEPRYVAPSPSHESLPVTPVDSRSMPSLPFPLIELPRITTRVVEFHRYTPSVPLPT